MMDLVSPIKPSIAILNMHKYGCLLFLQTNIRAVSVRHLNLQEYQSKSLMQENGVNVQRFMVADTMNKAQEISKTLSKLCAYCLDVICIFEVLSLLIANGRLNANVFIRLYIQSHVRYQKILSKSQ